MAQLNHAELPVSVPDVNNDMSEGEQEEQEYMGRTANEWLSFLPSLMSVTMIIFGIIFFSECSGIPSLPAYAIVFGTLSLANGFVAFVFRTKRDEARGVTVTSGGISGAAAIASAIIGLATLGCALWGAVITWPEISRIWDGSPDCAEPLFISGAFSSLIVWVIIAGMIIFCLASKLFSGKSKDGSSDSEPESKSSGEP